jgi:hypothetical protein
MGYSVGNLDLIVKGKAGSAERLPTLIYKECVMNIPSIQSLPPEDRKAVEMIAEDARQIMFDHYEHLPIDYRITLEDVIKNAHRILDDDYWMTI